PGRDKENPVDEKSTGLFLLEDKHFTVWRCGFHSVQVERIVYRLRKCRFAETWDGVAVLLQSSCKVTGYIVQPCPLQHIIVVILLHGIRQTVNIVIGTINLFLSIKHYKNLRSCFCIRHSSKCR